MRASQEEVLNAARDNKLWVSYSLGRDNPLYGIEGRTISEADVLFAVSSHYIQRQAVAGLDKPIYQITTRGLQALKELSS